MPRTYKQPFKTKYKNITPKNTKPPPPENLPTVTNTPGIFSGFMSNMVHGFSFGTGVQAAKEMFSTSPHQQEPQSITENSSNYCIAMKKQMDECNDSMQYDCTFLNDLMRQKCIE